MNADASDGRAPGVRRQLPRWQDVSPLLKSRLREKDRVRRRVSHAFTLEDLAEIARRRTPRAVFEYVSGAADAEHGLRRAEAAWAGIEFHPRVLRDVSAADTATTVLDRPASMPLILAPTGFTRMLHPEGEIAVVRAAERAGVPYCLSSMGSISIEDVAAAVSRARLWFQLYLWKDRDIVRDLLVRAGEAGYEALVLTVDTPTMGNRVRDRRNGLTIPPTLTVRTVSDMARHPSWWLNVLTTPPLSFASFTSLGGSMEEIGHNMFNPTLDVDDLRWLRRQWAGKLVVKGVQCLDDARLVVDAGADALILSNHGGRQLDRGPAPVELLPSVVDAIGDQAEIYVDTGITNGADVVAAVGLGARAGMVGRAYLYGLMAGGQTGVERMLDIFHEEMRRTLQLMGAVGPDDVKGHVSLAAKSTNAVAGMSVG